MASGPITSWQIDGETMETVTDFIFWGSKITEMVTPTMKLKDTCSLESHSVVSDSAIPYSPWTSPGQFLEWVAVPFSRGSSQPRD